jgi:hypothetical protein
MASSTKKSRKTTKRPGASVGRYTHPEASGKYTKPVGAHVNESPRWYGPSIVAIMVLGLMIIILNYLGVLPDSVSQWYLLAGIVVIFAGFAAMMKFR